MNSPIERTLHQALLRVALDRDLNVRDYAAAGAEFEILISPEHEGGRPGLYTRRGSAPIAPVERPASDERRPHLDVASDATVAGYRIDLVVCYYDSSIPIHECAAGRTAILLVECDGHDWHERTPQQASRDRARDRDIYRRTGLAVLRFTGSDIHRDADSCAVEILETAVVEFARHQSLASVEAEHSIMLHGWFNDTRND
jgi:hypothetical protein